MSEENKDKILPVDPEENDAEQPVQETQTADDWQWDAAVPETETDNISFDELAHGVSTEVTETTEEDNDPEEAEEEITEEEPKEEAFCIVCGKPLGDSPSELYCNECREKFLRTDYGAGHIIFAFVMVVLAAISYFVCISTGSFALKTIKAEDLLKEKRYNDVMTVCEEITSDVDSVNAGVNSVFASVNKNFASKKWFSAGKKLDMICLDAYVDILTTSNSEHENFVAMVENRFVDKNSKFDYSQLEKPKYAKVKKAYDFSKGLIDASDEYMAGMEKFVSYNDDSSMKIDYKKATEYIDGLETKTQAQKCMADYCRFIAAFYANQKNDVIFSCFDSLCENAGEFDYMFWQTYMEVAFENKDYDKTVEIAEKSIKRNPNDTSSYSCMIEAYTMNGDLDKAGKACDEMQKANPDGLDYYGMKAAVLRRQGDFDGAVKVCKDGIAKGEDAEIYRQQAIAYMLLDDKDNALEAVKQAYNIDLQNAYSGQSSAKLVETLNTAALITRICGDDKTYDEIIAIFENEKVELNKSVQSCIKGDITFEDIFMKGTGEV